MGASTRYNKSMKILQLNAWTGRIKYNVVNFIRNNDFDVICLQEAVWTEDDGEELEYFFASLRQIQQASGLLYIEKISHWGISLGGKNIERVEQGNVILSRFPIKKAEIREISGEYDERFMSNADEVNNQLYTAIKVELENGLTVLNYHGFWRNQPMGDEVSTECMKRVAEMIKGTKGPVVMCGDLNLVYEAPAMQELDFLHDLTHDFGVKNTLVKLKVKNDVACDHILVNDRVKVNSFAVLSNEIVSDHMPLVADIEI